jgi:hypothetical protein
VPHRADLEGEERADAGTPERPARERREQAIEERARPVAHAWGV